MQRLRELIRPSGLAPEPQRWNLCREYLQVLALKSIYSLPTSKSLLFQGGTCLRLCHQIKRWSEDLDFSWSERPRQGAFRALHEAVRTDLSRRGFETSGSLSEEKVVQKAFVRVGGLAQEFGFSMPKDQKLSIKIEIDRRPPRGGGEETFFVNRFGEIFPIRKFDLPTLFAGKALAILLRPYDRGRDYYDLVWFLSQKVEGNLRYLASGMRQAKPRGRAPGSWDTVLDAIAKKVESVDPAVLTKDMRPFLEDPADLRWLENYVQVFRQLRKDHRSK